MVRKKDVRTAGEGSETAGMTREAYTVRTINLLGIDHDVRIAGTGAPLLVLHRDTGMFGWTPLLAALAAEYRVMAPVLPGYDGTPRHTWMRSVRDLATVTGLVVDALALGPLPVLGLGYGGWVAAELAAQDPARFTALVLQAPMGIKASGGEILDQFLYPAEEYIELGFAASALYDDHKAIHGEDRARIIDGNRETTMRIAWRPVMHALHLPHILPAIDRPALVISGDEDRIVPPSCSRDYAALLPRGRHVALRGCGHFIDFEAPEEIVALVRDALLLEPA